MKKITLSIITLAISLSSFAQWTNQSGTSNYYLNPGNVGIGLVNPTNPLEVVGPIVARNNATATQNNISINAGNTTTPGSANVNRLRIGGNDANTGYFTIQGVSNQDLLTINGTNVGIGTTTPGAKVDIRGETADINAYSIVLRNSNAISLFSVRNDGRVDFPTGGVNMPIGPVVFPGSSAWTAAGNLGIGLTNPNNPLEVVGNIVTRNNNTTTVNSVSLNAGNTNTPGSSNVNRLRIGGNDAYTGYFTIQGPSNVDYLTIYGGNVGIGTTTPDQKLTVNGSIHSKEVKVDLNVPAPDYVFDNGFQLTTLPELKSYLAKNHHLPEIPSAAEMAKSGLDLGEMNIKLLKKVEELTLYLIEKDRELSEQKQADQKQNARIEALEKALLKLSAVKD